MRKEVIREKLRIVNITERCRRARLRWFGHVKRGDEESVGRGVLEMHPQEGDKEGGRN